MDTKERWMIERLHSIILSGSFHERDVLALFIILRYHAKGNSFVKEFGDFIAHREKDRGILKTVMQSIQSKLDNHTQPSFIVITNIDIQKSLNETFLELKLSEIGNELANQITVCIISLLQSVSIKIRAQSNTLGLKLSVGITRQYIWLLGKGQLPAGHIVNFPLLIAQNTFIPSDFDDTPLILNDQIETRFINGNLQYEFNN